MFATLLVGLAPLVLSDVAQAEDACPAQVPPAHVEQALTAIETAYGAFDGHGIVAAGQRLDATLPCLSEPVTPELAARVHAAQGLRALWSADEAAARQAFAAVRSADADATLAPAAVDPDDDQLPEWVHFDAIPLEAGRVDPIPDLGVGTVWLDGRPATERPANWPTLFQAPDAQAPWTSYLWPDDPIVAAPAEKRTSRSSRAWPWVTGGTSLALAAVGGALYGGAWGAWGKHCTKNADGGRTCPVTEEEDFYADKLRPQFGWGVGLMVAGGIGLGATGVTAAVTAPGNAP